MLPKCLQVPTTLWTPAAARSNGRKPPKSSGDPHYAMRDRHIPKPWPDLPRLPDTREGIAHKCTCHESATWAVSASFCTRAVKPSSSYSLEDLRLQRQR